MCPMIWAGTGCPPLTVPALQQMCNEGQGEGQRLIPCWLFSLFFCFWPDCAQPGIFPNHPHAPPFSPAGAAARPISPFSFPLSVDSKRDNRNRDQRHAPTGTWCCPTGVTNGKQTTYGGMGLRFTIDEMEKLASKLCSCPN